MLRDLAQQVREKVTPAGVPQLEQRGLEAVEALAAELLGPDGLPGLKLCRDAPGKFRLQRANKVGEITVEWQGKIGALEVLAERPHQPRRLVRYLHDQETDTWRPMNGVGELYADLTASLVDYLYPEVKK